MSQIIPINIPTYISDQNYNPTRVLPRLLFYNGLLDCESYYIESGSLTNSGVSKELTSFPYFDNYNVVSGSFPTTDSDSLLFNNENASYGQIPNQTLYTNYWETYINLLYNPKTRLLNASAIIPLADYVKMELNDIINFRGNYFHLRAINDYSLKTGECNLQLLGPIIADTFSAEFVPPIPTTTTTAGPTTTTTAGPVTTTTTFSPDPCICTEVNITSVGGEVATFNCYGVNENYVYATAGIRYICAASIGGLLQASIVSGTGTVTPVGNCKTQACPPATTTTTTTAGPTTTTTTLPTTTTTTTTTLPTTTTTTTTIAPTTTTTIAATTTTTTIAPYCTIWTATNAFGAGYTIRYVYCGQTSNTFVEVPPFSSITLCVQNGQISNLGNPITLTEGGVCNATTTTTSTTTTTTLAPGCFIYNVVNNGVGTGFVNYVYCDQGSTYQQFFLAGGASGSLCVDNHQINNGGNFNMNFTNTGVSCVSTTTTTTSTTTTTTTTLPPFSNQLTADAWFDRTGLSFEVAFTGSNSSLTSSIIT